MERRLVWKGQRSHTFLESVDDSGAQPGDSLCESPYPSRSHALRESASGVVYSSPHHMSCHSLAVAVSTLSTSRNGTKQFGHLPTHVKDDERSQVANAVASGR